MMMGEPSSQLSYIMYTPILHLPCQKSEGNGILSREILEHAVGNDDNNVACDAAER